MTDRSVVVLWSRAMSYLQTSTGPIAYDEYGQGHTIVLLPSGAHGRHDYDELRGLLRTGFRSVSLDWPGHGDSPAGDAAATAMRFADIAEQLVEQVAPSGALVVGNSVGGFAAARMAIRRPELVKGLAIVDGGGFSGRPLQLRAFCSLMSRPWFLRRIYPSFSRHYMRSRTAADRRARETAVANTRQNPCLGAVAELCGSFASPQHDLRSEAHSIAAPTLLVWGRRDPVIPVKIARRVATAIRDSQLVVLDTGHVPHTSDPDGFAAHLIPFADRVFTGVETGVAR
jgi:pimeloyl-ACP methyl ester carboxylesterase